MWLPRLCAVSIVSGTKIWAAPAEPICVRPTSRNAVGTTPTICVADAVQDDRTADDRRISAKRAHPERLREQGDRRRAGLLIFSAQRSPDDRREAEHLEQRRGHGASEDALRIAMLRESEVPCR